jgi:hypothetical protein
MANKKFTTLEADPTTVITTPAPGDFILIHDISEPLLAKQVKAITYADLVKLVTQTAVQALITGQTTGDLFYADTATALARLAKGTAGQTLKMNSGGTLPEWGNGGMTLIEEKVLASPAANFDFTSIPTTYRNLQLIINARGTKATTLDFVYAIFNNDSGANYDYEILSAVGGTGGGGEGLSQVHVVLGGIAGSLCSAGLSGHIQFTISDYRNTVFNKVLNSLSSFKVGTSSGNLYCYNISGFWRSSNAINRITVIPASDNFDTDSVASLYGLA